MLAAVTEYGAGWTPTLSYLRYVTLILGHRFIPLSSFCIVFSAVWMGSDILPDMKTQ